MTVGAPAFELLSPDPTQLRQVMSRALAMTFEELTFMDADAVASHQTGGAGYVYAQIASRAPVALALTLQMSVELVDDCIDALFSGMEPSPIIREDVVRELINTIAGSMLASLCEDRLIELGLPQSSMEVPTMGDPGEHHQLVQLGSLVLEATWR